MSHHHGNAMWSHSDSCCCHGRCDCGCGHESAGSFSRSYYSRKEKQEWLEEYRDQLKRELEAVDERLEELKRK